MTGVTSRFTWPCAARLTPVTHHKVPDGPVEDGAIVIVLLAELDEVFAGFWCLQNSPDTSVRHTAANEWVMNATWAPIMQQKEVQLLDPDMVRTPAAAEPQSYRETQAEWWREPDPLGAGCMLACPDSGQGNTAHG